MKVYAAINAVQAALSKAGVGKTRKNLQQGYSFRGIDEVMNALSPILATEKLCILPRVMTRETTERASKSGGLLFSTILEIEYDIVHSEDASRHTVRVVGEAMDSADKSCNKALAAGYKYACVQTFCIPTEGDNDADATTHEPVIHVQRAPAAQTPAARTPVDPRVGGSDGRPSGAEVSEGAARPVGAISPRIAPSVTREPGEDDDLRDELPAPAGALLVTSIQQEATKNPNVKKSLINFSDGRVRSTINDRLVELAERCYEGHFYVRVQDKQTRWGFDLVKLERAS